VTGLATRRVESEDAMLMLGAELARDLRGGDVVTLSGELGAGKTTLVRGVLSGLGFDGRVKSPSYGLVETYDVGGLVVHHLDLYRLADPAELDFIGLDDLVGSESALLVEWPERAGGLLPEPDRHIQIELAGSSRQVEISVGPGTS
jgi:tRNA threonylcarbamoyladenosine biosynthesis protein TsaE